MAHVLTHKHVGHHTDDDHHETIDRDDRNNNDTRQEKNTRRDTREHAIVDKDMQRAEYGGIHLGPTFFGWLVATGMAAILTALLTALGSAVALTTGESANTVAGQTASTVGIVGGVSLLIALGLAYYAGGYVAGRMARFDGGRQGFGVWLIGIILTVILGGLGAALGSQFNLLQQLNLPRLPINEGTLTTAGLVTLIATVLITLLAAIAGGKRGAHYHDTIDETGRVGTATT